MIDLKRGRVEKRYCVVVLSYTKYSLCSVVSAIAFGMEFQPQPRISADDEAKEERPTKKAKLEDKSHDDGNRTAKARTALPTDYPVVRQLQDESQETWKEDTTQCKDNEEEENEENPKAEYQSQDHPSESDDPRESFNFRLNFCFKLRITHRLVCENWTRV